ncbi:MAG: DUF4238 domain-containing protein [Bryobacteraceae bacterium]
MEALEKKRQHIIPKSYQKPWCDPTTPSNQTPYIWMISRDGSEKRRKAPEKAFRENDAYTIRLASGDRELVVEDTLAQIESKFAHLIQHKIRKQYALDAQDRANLCVFAAAMYSRVDPQSRSHVNFLQELHDKVQTMEEAHNCEARTSLETAAMLENARPKWVATSLEILAPLYYKMSLAIFVAPSTDHFITSDSPTAWYNPDAYKWPPFGRSPGLAQQKVEVTLPLTSNHVLYLSHDEKISGYRQCTSKIVQEFNRRTRFHCDQWFVSWKGEVRDSWFENGKLPDDCWENTPAGERAVKQNAKYDELRQRYR